MKRFILSFIIMGCMLSLHAQFKPDIKMETTTTLPEGTQLKNGKITVLPGYKAFISPKDSKVLLVQRSSMNRSARTNVTTGSFTCSCYNEGKDDCTIIFSLGEARCYGKECKACNISVIVNPKAGAALTRLTKGETWKRFLMPEEKQ